MWPGECVYAPWPITQHPLAYQTPPSPQRWSLPSLMQAHGKRMSPHVCMGCKHLAYFECWDSPFLPPTLPPLFSAVLKGRNSLSFFPEDGKRCWPRCGERLQRGRDVNSRASRGSNLVNGGDLSSNSPSGGTLGLLSEVLKVGFYGVCCVIRSFCFTCFFHYTEANYIDNREVNTALPLFYVV